MDYEAGTATDPVDMLNKIRLFLVANGWTQLAYAAATSGYRLSVQRGAVFINAYACTNYNPNGTATVDNLTGLAFATATGFSASPGGTRPWKNMPGAPGFSSAVIADNILGSTVPGMSLSINPYWMAADGDNFVCCINVATGTYRWVAFGTLIAINTLGASPNGFVLFTSAGPSAPVANQINVFAAPSISVYTNGVLRFNDTWYFSHGSTTPAARVVCPLQNPTAVQSGAVAGLLFNLFQAMPGAYGMLAPLLPCYVGIELDGSYDVLLGHLELVRLTHMGAFSDAQEITIGTDEFIVLPADTLGGNWDYGVAMRIA